MGGMNLSDLQNWDKQGRKRGMSEQLTNVLKAVLEGAQTNENNQMTRSTNMATMADKGFQPKAQQGGMAGLLSSLAGGQGQYEKGPMSPETEAGIAAKQAYANYYDYLRQKQTNGSPNTIPLVPTAQTAQAPTAMASTAQTSTAPTMDKIMAAKKWLQAQGFEANDEQAMQLIKNNPDSF